ncbi:hypothetical protein [Mycolicibacter sinensis]
MKLTNTLFTGIALVFATAGAALSVSCATSAAGPNDKYVHPTKPITDPVQQRAFVCDSFDHYGVRGDVIDGMLQDLASWGRSSFTKGIIDAAVYGECPQYMNSYLAVIREQNQSRR